MKKLALALCSITILYLFALPVHASNLLKDETVYVQLDYNGNLQGQQVVNHLFSNQQITKFTDIISNKDLVNLTDLTSPIIDSNTVEWNTQKPTTDFYYQSTSQQAIPFIFDIKYTLNDNKITADQLIGKSGNIGINVSVKPNKQSKSIYRKNMMAQLSINLDSDYAMNIIAPEATKVVTGKLNTLNYVVFAEQSETFNITFEASDFEMEGWTISIIPSGFSLPPDMENQLDDMTNGFNQMENSMGQMVNGTQRLKNGLDDLSSGMSTLNKNYKSFLTGTNDLISNVTPLLNGVVSLEPGIKGIKDGSKNVKDGLNELSTNGDNLVNGMSQIHQGYEGVITDDIRILAQSLSGSSDEEVQKLALAILKVDQLNTQMGGIVAGTNEFVGGVNTINTSYDSFHEGINNLYEGITPLAEGSQQAIQGLDDYKNGAQKLGNGIDTLDKEVKNIPNQVQKIVNGQKEFKLGIQEASTTMSDELKAFTSNSTPTLLSFVNGEEQEINSLQFIIKTPNIQKDNEDKTIEKITESKNFWHKLLDLFNLE